MQVFNYWVLGATILSFVSYLSAILLEKGKKYFHYEKVLDRIENKYDSLRSSRREMLVILLYL
jgi:hypothetical protein